MADPERYAVRLKRKNPVRTVDILRREIASEAVDCDEVDLHLRRLDAAEDLAEQRAFEGRRGPEFGGRRRYRALLEPEQHGAIEGECPLEIGLLQGEQTVFPGIERAPIALANRPAHGEQNHVLRRLLLLGGWGWQGAERRDESNKDRAHKVRTGRVGGAGSHPRLRFRSGQGIGTGRLTMPYAPSDAAAPTPYASPGT